MTCPDSSRLREGHRLVRSREHRRVEAEVRVVGEAEGLVGVLDPHDGDERPERLLAHDGHLLRGAEEERRLEEVAGEVAPALPARGETGPLRERVGELPLDDLELSGKRHRPEIVRAVPSRLGRRLPEGLRRARRGAPRTGPATASST